MKRRDDKGSQCLNPLELPKKKKKRFKYHFGPQPLAFVSNWSLTFQLCQISSQPFNLVSKSSLPLSIGWKILTWLMVFFNIKNV